MKKAFLLLTLCLTLAFSAVSVMAAESPVADSVEEDGATDTNDDKTSPKTGADMSALVAIVSAAGVALVSAKKLAEVK